MTHKTLKEMKMNNVIYPDVFKTKIERKKQNQLHEFEVPVVKEFRGYVFVDAANYPDATTRTATATTRTAPATANGPDATATATANSPDATATAVIVRSPYGEVGPQAREWSPRKVSNMR